MKKSEDIAYFSFPTNIRFGSGSIGLLDEILKSNHVKKPLFVTDEGLANLPLTKKVLGHLQNKNVSVFSGISGNPTEIHVQEGVKVFQSHGSDSIIAFGGGAVNDVAKAIALLIRHPGKLFDYEEGHENIKPFDQPIPFLLAIPTTAGTGSEVGRSAVISDSKTKIKRIIFSPRLLPKVVLADPELILDLPAKITASTGMDALTHLVETYLAKGYHPICDGIALEGVKLIQRGLSKSVRNGHDLEARKNMLMASIMGAIAFQKGLGVTHSLAHALSTVCDLHHGLANGILLPYCLEFNLDARRERLTVLAETIHIKNKKPEGFIRWVVDLKKEIGIPEFLSEVGVTSGQLNKLVEIAYQDPVHHCNFKKVKKADIRRLFERALE